MPFFAPGDLELWPLTLAFKLVWARDQTRLPCEFGANPFSGSRDISCTDKNHTLMEPKKQNLPQFTACNNKSKLPQDVPKNVMKSRKAVQHWCCTYSFSDLCWSYFMWAAVIGAGFVPAGFLPVAKPQGTRTPKGSLPNQVEEEKLATHVHLENGLWKRKRSGGWRRPHDLWPLSQKRCYCSIVVTSANADQFTKFSIKFVKIKVSLEHVATLPCEIFYTFWLMGTVGSIGVALALLRSVLYLVGFGASVAEWWRRCTSSLRTQFNSHSQSCESL